MDMLWRIELLGGLRAVHADRVITRFRTQKTASLLAYLAYYGDRSHPREVLIDLFWRESSLAAGRNSLKQELSSLRRQLEPPGAPTNSVLVKDRFHVGLNPTVVSTDTGDFRTALQLAREAEIPENRIIYLTRALETYKGELLPGFYEDWVLEERHRLAALHQAALRQLADTLKAIGNPEASGLYAARPIAIDPSNQMVQPPPHRRRLHPPNPATKVIPTLLLVEVEGPAPLWARMSVSFATALSACHERLRELFHLHRGLEIEAVGGAFLVTFESSEDAVKCAAGAQRAIAESPCREEFFGMRMALHRGDLGFPGIASGITAPVGEPWMVSPGPVLCWARQLLLTARRGQILCSAAVEICLRQNLPTGVKLLDLGLCQVQDGSPPDHIFLVEYPGCPGSLQTAMRVRPEGNLPARLTRFFGREEELHYLAWLVHQGNRLVTLTGPGGSGKSRLSVEAALYLSELLQRPAWFVSLVEITTPPRILEAVRHALRLPQTSRREPMEEVAQALSRQPSLLILDNFEQLLQSPVPGAVTGRETVREILEQVPSLICIISSRQRLGLAGEREMVVGPLPTPGEETNPAQVVQNASVRLFVDRAQAMRPDFQVTGRNAAAVSALCNELEGIPLAIELAAARSKVLTPTQMLRQMGRRYDLLVSRQQITEARHLTLRACIDWSFHLLNPGLKKFFAHLSIFRGGWTAEAASQVMGSGLQMADVEASSHILNSLEILDSLEILRECSLIQAKETGLEMRFSMLETLRSYAEEQLSLQDLSELQQNHASYFLSLVSNMETNLGGPDQVEWLNRLEVEKDNLRSALGWSYRSQNGEFCSRLGLALGELLRRSGPWNEAGQCLEMALEATRWLPGDTRYLQSSIQCALARVAHDRGDLEDLRRWANESLALRQDLEEPAGIAEVLNLLGALGVEERNLDQAEAYFHRALTLCSLPLLQTSVLIPSLSAIVTDSQSIIAHPHSAIPHLQSQHRIRTVALHNLGKIASLGGDFEKSHRYYEEALAEREAVGDIQGQAETLTNLGALAYKRRNYRQAGFLYHRSLVLWKELHDRYGAAITLYNLAELSELDSQPGKALQLFTYSQHLFMEIMATEETFASEQFERLSAALPPETLAGIQRQVDTVGWEAVVEQAQD